MSIALQRRSLPMATMTPTRTRKYSFEQFTAIRRYQPALDFSPDGSEIAYSTNTSGQFNLWRQPSDGGYPRQLTVYSDNAVREISWSPDGETILFTADHQGDEFTRPHLIPAKGGRPEQVTGEPDVRYYLGAIDAWSPNGRYFAYAANDREPIDQDVLIYDTQTGHIQRPLAGDGNFTPLVWSPDGKYLTAVEFRSNTDQVAYIISVDGREVRAVAGKDDMEQYVPLEWAADGSGFWMLTSSGREFQGLAFYNIADDQFAWVETPDWDIEQASATADGRYLIWVVNEDGYSKLHGKDLTTGVPLALPELPGGMVTALKLSRDGHKIGLLLNRATHPAEVYVVDIERGSLAQITDGFLGGIDEADLVEPELIHFPTFDGKQIPGFLYRPEGEGPFPVVLSIHGGPEAQERPVYMFGGMYQYLLSLGIGVLATNIRGSTGYGKTYQKLIHRDFGGDDLKDMEAAAQYLQSLSWVDSKKIGVFGGSYGGFAVLSCVSRLPDYWAAAVDIVGPSNLVTFAKAVPPTWKRFMADWVGDPETEADFLMERSPITYVDQIKAPLFVIQGANDPRVVKSESDQIVHRLRERGVEVRYDVYEDEGHGFTKRENDLKSLADTTEFFAQHLLG
jgi:dipeptidyl aminopeptidase/acylaminoacyl peptidase